MAPPCRKAPVNGAIRSPMGHHRGNLPDIFPENQSSWSTTFFPKTYCQSGPMGLRWPQVQTEGAHMKVDDLIHSRTDIYSVTEDTTVHETARYLRDKQVRAVGVLKPDGKLL